LENLSFYFVLSGQLSSEDLIRQLSKPKNVGVKIFAVNKVGVNKVGGQKFFGIDNWVKNVLRSIILGCPKYVGPKF
jgi:hypothetical protein